jgi:hypothetical protein
MVMAPITQKRRAIIHWLWLWLLVAIAISVLHGRLHGQIIEAPRPIPLPNIDHPEWFQYPREIPPARGTLSDVLHLNQTRDDAGALRLWQGLRMMPDSQTWKHVGIGVAQLRLEKTDNALAELRKAMDKDPSNAVAEYFLGRACQQRQRQQPFWYERNKETPFQLAAVRLIGHRKTVFDVMPASSGSPDKNVLLPQFESDSFGRRAKRHFRRAVELSAGCDLDRAIRVLPSAEQLIQLTRAAPASKTVTVRDLLISLGEEDYLAKARQEIGTSAAGSED